MFTIFLLQHNVVVLLGRFDDGLFGAVGPPVESQEKKEVLDSRECKHQRGGCRVVTVEDERLELIIYVIK